MITIDIRTSIDARHFIDLIFYRKRLLARVLFLWFIIGKNYFYIKYHLSFYFFRQILKIVFKNIIS